ncbi:glycosyltransferase family 2 protein [Flavobacterium sp. XS1P32]|uniref:glycosyltransferase family 2 protein n=1 Tax=Flavobacterium sp. XS1P32 TaxID=3401726 RepID=UPI003AAE407C
MNNISISIIVPCYNQAQYLHEALQSVLDQTYTNWECIIVNDGSPDDTKQIAQKWVEKDLRFKYIYKENGGLSSARNAGLAVAVGEFIQFLDSDDLIEKSKLEYQLAFMLDHPTIDISVSGYRYFGKNQNEKLILGRNNFLPEIAIMEHDIDIINVLNLRNPMVISAPLYKRNVFNIIGLFDTDLSALEDWDFHTRCALHKLKFQHIGYFLNSFALIRLHSESMMSNQVKMNNAYLVYKEKRSKNKMYTDQFPLLPAKKKSYKKIVKSIIFLCVPPIIVILVNKLKNIIYG